jgi:hypothetical protein
VEAPAVLLVVALILAILAALPIPSPVNLLAAAFAFFLASELLR